MNKIEKMDIVEFWSTMQSRIFTTVSVGKRNAHILIDYELENGQVEKRLFGDVIKVLLADAMNRALGWPFIILPELLPYPITSFCRSYKRNVMAIRNAIQKMMDDRRQGKNKSYFGDNGDLLSILLSDQLYQGNDEKTKDELIIFFLAGNETIKTSSTNTVCFLTQNPEIRKKFMSEITPVLERTKDDFIQNLTSEDVDSFEYVRRCWYETMRIQPPTSITTPNAFIKTVKIKGIEFTPSTNFCINFDSIHNDPIEWIEPNRYDPDRFDP